MRLGPPSDHKHLDRRGGAQFSGSLWRRVGSAGAAEGGARLSILVFLFRHRYRDPGRPDRLAIAADANKRVLDCGRNRQVDALRSNQLWLVSVASVPEVIDASGYGNAEGLYSSEIAIRSGRTNSATTLALCRRRCWSRVLDGPRCDGGDIAEWSFPRSKVKRSRRHDVSGLAIHRPGRRTS